MLSYKGNINLRIDYQTFTKLISIACFKGRRSYEDVADVFIPNYVSYKERNSKINVKLHQSEVTESPYQRALSKQSRVLVTDRVRETHGITDAGITLSIVTTRHRRSGTGVLRLLKAVSSALETTADGHRRTVQIQ